MVAWQRMIDTVILAKQRTDAQDMTAGQFAIKLAPTPPSTAGIQHNLFWPGSSILQLSKAMKIGIANDFQLANRSLASAFGA